MFEHEGNCWEAREVLEGAEGKIWDRLCGEAKREMFKRSSGQQQQLDIWVDVAT